jgi:hypothetical protein
VIVEDVGPPTPKRPAPAAQVEHLGGGALLDYLVEQCVRLVGILDAICLPRVLLGQPAPSASSLGSPLAGRRPGAAELSPWSDGAIFV